jgi:nifR3 family TIM-barrel protein
MNLLESLNRPFFVLAPMDDVTETVFRQTIASCHKPDLFFTEFVNVEGLQSKGRKNLIHKLKYTKKDKPLIAQIWGKNPENYYKVSAELVDMGFDGVDINMGCPDKSVVKSGCCSALINNRQLAVEIISAVKAGVNNKVPVSVKLRTGFNEVDFSWPELVLKQNINMLTVHGRTTKELSKVPARWDDIKKVRQIRDEVSPKTLIVGNGDVLNREQGEVLAKETGVDGIMIGRGSLFNPFVFQKNSNWQFRPEKERLKIYLQHAQLFKETYSNGQRNWQSLKRLTKLYIHGSENASKFRNELVRAEDIDKLIISIKERIYFLS